MSQKKSRSYKVFNSKVTSTLSISFVLYLIGIMVVASFYAKNLTDYVKENIGVTVVIKDGIKSSSIVSYQNQIKKQKWVKKVTYINKEDALKQLTQELGENPEEFLGFNPTSASFDIYFNSEYSNPEFINSTVESLEKLDYVQDVVYRKNLVTVISSNLNKLKLIFLIIFGVLSLISLMLIKNTVRLLIYSKRFMIRTMQLVGAKNSFIRKPFVRANLINGIIAAFLGFIYLYGFLLFLQYKGLPLILDKDMFIITFGILLLSGIIITTLATIFSVNRYLKMETGNLYYI